MRVLLVEDEEQLRMQITASLRKAGFVVDACGDGREALFFGNEYPIDVAVLDLGLPDMDGLAVLQGWRAAGRSFPVLILTARDRWQDKVQGLEAGADDYLVKPFYTEEVLARLRALLRRATGWSNAVINAGYIALDTSAQQVAVAGEPVELTAFEYRLLDYLVHHAGQVISKSTLAEHIYEEENDPDSNVLEVLVARLRKKLDPDRSRNPIETLRGRGYRFRLEASDE